MRSFTLTPHNYVASRHGNDTDPKKVDGKWFLPVEHINTSAIKSVRKANEFWEVQTASGSVYLIID